MRLPICLAVYWSHQSLPPKPCEPAGLFQSGLMARWRSQGELCYMCHENWLFFREGLTWWREGQGESSCWYRVCGSSQVGGGHTRTHQVIGTQDT